MSIALTPSMAPLVGSAVACFLNDVRTGLRQRQKRLPCKYLYDQRSSQLFDQIGDLDEYYPTRTELAITRRYAEEIANQIGVPSSGRPITSISELAEDE